MIASHLPVDGIVLDIGANAGYMTRLFSGIAPQGHVYAFEPGSYARSILTRVVSIRGIKNASIQPFGLGDAETTLELHLPVKKSGSLGFGLGHIGNDKNVDARATVSEKIAIRTIDSFAASTGITRIDLIKIDIEGWELRALEGGKRTLEKHRPVLMLEMVDRFLGRAGDSSQKMWDFLKALNYDIYRYNDQGQTDLLEAPIHEGDILCLPR